MMTDLSNPTLTKRQIAKQRRHTSDLTPKKVAKEGIYHLFQKKVQVGEISFFLARYIQTSKLRACTWNTG